MTMTATPTPQTWARTRQLMRSDLARLLAMMGNPRSPLKRAFWFVQPTQLGLTLYRTYHYCYLRGWRNAANVLYTLNLYLTRVEIPPATSIGESCLLGHLPIVLCGRIGDRFTFFGDGGCGGGFDNADIGGGPGLPVIGDDVVFAVRAMALGPIRVGNGARLGPSCTVTHDVPAGATVAAPPSRVMRARQAGEEVQP